MADPRATKSKDDPRKTRLKAALKANMAKRKAQARARTSDTPNTVDAKAGQKSE